MARYEVEGPDGSLFEVEGPDGAQDAQIIAAIGGINFLTSILGDKPIFSMVIAGISLIIAGLLNLLITDKKTISY